MNNKTGRPSNPKKWKLNPEFVKRYKEWKQLKQEIENE